ncbi:hypothetical protein [Shewanella halifaxensis]|uniref:hypothetical protein n=1 Tax=Shewanella halifaxensis TaxID=271098 RepID=UPI000D5A1793|nr:hypothetical protein [Shewanella halifaxensis]
MTLVIKEMAGVTVPKGLLDQIDMPSLINGFKSDYDKLDDLKAARNKHEQRNALSRWWNSDELDDAQLDAAELQASFSKKLGQLMVISIEQSKLLTQQQSHLTKQQNTIKEQTLKLASANKQLDEQQKKQMEQQVNLEELVENYFELKGLTAKDAQKLILIANEVKEIRTCIFAKLDKELISISLLKDSLLADFEEGVVLFNSRLEQSEAKLFEELKLVSDGLGQQFEEAKKSLIHAINDTNTLLDEHVQHLTDFTKETGSVLSKLQVTYQEQFDGLTTKIRQLDLHHEKLLSEQELVFLNNHNEIQASLEKTDFNLSKLQETSQDKIEELQGIIEQLVFKYEKQQADQQEANISNNLKFESALMEKNKQVKMLTIGLITSFIIGASSLGVVLYPLLSKLS